MSKASGGPAPKQLSPIQSGDASSSPVIRNRGSLTRTAATNAANAAETARLRDTLTSTAAATASGATLAQALPSSIRGSSNGTIHTPPIAPPTALSTAPVGNTRTSKELWNQAAVNAKGVLKPVPSIYGYNANALWRASIIKKARNAADGRAMFPRLNTEPWNPAREQPRLSTFGKFGNGLPQPYIPSFENNLIATDKMLGLAGGSLKTRRKRIRKTRRMKKHRR